MNGNNSVPNIRFKGFEDKWKINRLLSITTVYSGLTYKPEDIQTSGTLVLRSSNIQEGKIIKKDCVYVNSSVVNSINVEKKDVILVVRNGSKKLIGKHAIVMQNMKNTVIGAFMSGLRPKNGDFLNALLNTETFKKEVFRSLGATINQITNKDLKRMKFYLPFSYEQQKIGNFFTKLDKLLDLQQQKIDKLELLKKTLLQKLFPKHDAQIPELRFKGFEDDWQEKKLSHVVDIIMGQSPSSTNYYDTPIENSMILIQGNADIKHHNVKPRIWTTQITKIAIPKDVLLTVRAPVGEVAKNKYEAVIGRGMAALRGNDFLYYNLEKLKEVGYWERLSTGSTFESISSNDIRDTKIKIPSCKEQKKVYNLLSKVDQLIELENQKLQNFQQVKKCLLQNMFVE